MSDSFQSAPVECPNCNTAIPSGQQYCPQCGVDLILFTDLIFRQRLEEALAVPPEELESVEELIPRLGDSLVAQKIITAEQLHQALEAQSVKLYEGGTPPRIGQILISMGFLRPEQLDRAIATMVAQLQKALQTANHTLEARVRERTQELSQALERLSELNQLKANFVANISHELRTPMTHIVGYLDLLNDDTFGPVTPQQHEALDTIHRATERLDHLIEDLIEFADSSRGGIALHFQQFSLRDAIQEALERLKSKAQHGRVRIVVSIPEDLPPVNADYRRIAWVLSELIDNGIKFTPGDGTVTIRAGLASRRVWVSVEDTGIGIPESRVGELFEPFHQLDGSSTRRQGGTGLGLSLCQQIIEAHGSKITIHSQEGRGSTFLFDLSMVRKETAEGTTQAQLPLSHPPS